MMTNNNSQGDAMQVGDKIKVGRRNFTITRINEPTTEHPHQAIIDNGWDGNFYWVNGPRGAHHLCYRAADSGKFSVVF